MSKSEKNEKKRNIENADRDSKVFVTHKDRVFRMVFKEKKEFLELVQRDEWNGLQ